MSYSIPKIEKHKSQSDSPGAAGNPDSSCAKLSTYDLSLDAFPYQEYGLVSGKATSISADAKPDEKLRTVYRIKVELNSNPIIANNCPVYFKADQTAIADIIISRRRIIDLILDSIKQPQKGGIKL